MAFVRFCFGVYHGLPSEVSVETRDADPLEAVEHVDVHPSLSLECRRVVERHLAQDCRAATVVHARVPRHETSVDLCLYVEVHALPQRRRKAPRIRQFVRHLGVAGDCTCERGGALVAGPFDF